MDRKISEIVPKQGAATSADLLQQENLLLLLRCCPRTGTLDL
jgi:hypothetical protein